MQIEVDIENLISRSIIDGILDSKNIQREVDRILKSEEYQKTLTANIKTRLDDIISSEDGKKQLDKSIVDKIAKSDSVQDKVDEILDTEEYQKILKGHVKTCLQEVILSEEGKAQILTKVKEYLENYEIEYDEDFESELNKGVSEILLKAMKDSFERLKV